jgi:diadenosine tetraphosphate (Ap4A) HIT family hydrolase
MTDSGCIFCEIISDKAEASIVFQDDFVTAFMDAFPVNPGHTLVVPNQHSPDLAGLDELHAGKMIQLARKLAGALRASSLRCEGVNLLLADGPVAGQTVFHVHLHVIPRFIGDPCGIRLHTEPPAAPAREQLDAHAAAIKRALDA